jgi:hypothetical protein
MAAMTAPALQGNVIVRELLHAGEKGSFIGMIG